MANRVVAITEIKLVHRARCTVQARHTLHGRWAMKACVCVVCLPAALSFQAVLNNKDHLMILLTAPCISRACWTESLCGDCAIVLFRRYPGQVPWPSPVQRPLVYVPYLHGQPYWDVPRPAASSTSSTDLAEWTRTPRLVGRPVYRSLYVRACSMAPVITS